MQIMGESDDLEVISSQLPAARDESIEDSEEESEEF